MRNLFAETLIRIVLIFRVCLQSYRKASKFGYIHDFIVLALISLVSYHSAFIAQASSISCASLSPVPPVYIAESQGEVFNVEIKISNIEDLQRCEFTIAYNSSLLDVVEVARENFFPLDTAFDFKNNRSYGYVTVNISASESGGPLSGSGILARLAFEVANAPITCIESVLKFDHIQLFNDNLELVDHKFVSAIFFWKSLQTKTPDEERSIDLYTQKRGKGLGEPGGSFKIGEVVNLTSCVTYANWPQQGLLVAFQVMNPLNETVLVLVTETGEDGIAYASFRIPQVSESIGNWTAISSVDIACEVVWDIATFQVGYRIGGETLPGNTHLTTEPFALYLILIVILTTSFVSARRIRKI